MSVSGIERDNICIMGKMNAGKSSLLNLITQAETSIVDETPGTTADTKISFAEIHGIGPVKFFDTPGLDEGGTLGEKKKTKALEYFDESDLILLIINPSQPPFDVERDIMDRASQKDIQLLLVFNLFNNQGEVERILQDLPRSKQYPHIIIKAPDSAYRPELLEFILKNYQSKILRREVLPFVERDKWYLMNVPMDIETPQFRFLRPQQMAVEEITRKFAYAVTYRMDLGLARSENWQKEKNRYMNFLNSIPGEKTLITDSQAMDIIHPWTPDHINLTTFSIMMLEYKTGELKYFTEGLKILEDLQPGDKILITEACQHSRIGDDIGTRQIPRYLSQKYPWLSPQNNIDYCFGKACKYPEDLTRYRLVIHCGGCMIDHQKFSARIRRAKLSGVPMTNYGLFMSFLQGKEALKRVIKPYRLEI